LTLARGLREQKLKNRLEAMIGFNGAGSDAARPCASSRAEASPISAPEANSSNERAVFVPQNTCAWQVLKGNAECGMRNDELKGFLSFIPHSSLRIPHCFSCG
jgi:hypothetical protein